MGKGEIARYEQFLLFPTVFSKDSYCIHVKTGASLGKRKHVTNFCFYSAYNYDMNWKAFASDKINPTQKINFALGRVEKNIVGKAENAGYKLHFSQNFQIFFLSCFFFCKW